MCPQAKTEWRGWNWRANFPLSWQGWLQLWRRSQCRHQGLLCPDGHSSHSSHCFSGMYMGVAVSCPGKGRDAQRFNSCFPDKPGWKWRVPDPVQHTSGRAQPVYRSVLPPAIPSNFISPSHPASWAAALALQMFSDAMEKWLILSLFNCR